MSARWLAVAVCLAAAGVGSPSTAQVYKNSTSFLADHPGTTMTPFDFTGSSVVNLGSSYQSGGVTANAPQLFGVPADISVFYAPYLLGRNGTVASAVVATLQFGGSLIGFDIGSPVNLIGSPIINSLVITAVGSNGFTRTSAFTIGADATTFVGFDIGDAGTTTVTISASRQFAVLDYITAVPEPGSWAMMLAGVGVAGLSLRRRRKPSVSVAL